MTRISSDSAESADGTAPARSYSAPRCTSRVASPPSSRIRLGPPSGHESARSVHHQYSSSVSPFQANTGMPLGLSGVPSGPTATAAAAWSWVEKILQEAQRTFAPRATSVSIRTAVWIVMCSEPVMRAPRSGCDSPYSRRVAIRPGISCSASWISLRPKAAKPRSATLKSAPVETVVVLMGAPGSGEWACGRAGSCGDGGGGRGAQAGGGAQGVGAVGALPGEVGIVAAEMAVRGGLLVDGAVQGELLPERAGTEVEVLGDEPGDAAAADPLGAERLDHHRHGVGDADRVGDLHLGPVGKARRHDVLGHPAGGVGGRAVDLGRVLAAER